jgi:hypothetical protein
MGADAAVALAQLRSSRKAQSDDEGGTPQLDCDDMSGVPSGAWSEGGDGPAGEGADETPLSSLQPQLGGGAGTLRSFFYFLEAELYRGYRLEADAKIHEENSKEVWKFFKTPYEVERFFLYGFVVCLDCFLSIFTYLPARLLIALFRLPMGLITRSYPVAHICDLLRVGLVLVCSLVLLNPEVCDISYLYHIIRGEVQSFIKLYVLFNLFDIFDTLFCSFGQDILDSLYVNDFPLKFAHFPPMCARELC